MGVIDQIWDGLGAFLKVLSPKVECRNSRFDANSQYFGPCAGQKYTGKNITAMKNEVYCMVICHNI